MLDENTLKELVPKAMVGKVTPEVVDTVNRLAEDPMYGQELADNYIHFLSVLRDKERCTLSHYGNCIQFYTLVETGSTLVNAFMQVFPERVAHRLDVAPKEDPAKQLSIEASRFNRNRVVAAIREMDTLSFKLVYRHLLYESIKVQADLMRTAKSEFVRQKASETLMNKLDTETGIDLNLNVSKESGGSVMQELRQGIADLVMTQQKVINNGSHSVKDIGALPIIKQDAYEE